MAPARFPKTPPPGPARREFPSANGSAHDITSASNPSLAPIRAGRPPATPPGPFPTGLQRAQANIANPSPIRPPVVHPAPRRVSREVFRINGSGGGPHHRDGTSSWVSVSSRGSGSTDEDESALSSEGDYAYPQDRFVSGHELRAISLRGRGVGNPLTWRPTPPPGSFHSQHQQSLRPNPHPSRNLESRASNGATSLSTDAERHELWAKVTNQRLRIRQLRATLTEKRREVRVLRSQKDKIDNAFMQILRPHLTSSRTLTSSGRPVAIVPTDEIERRFGDMQRIRNDYYSAESAYELLEADLDREESDLQAFEADLYHFLNIDTSESSEAPSDVAEESDSDDDGDDAVSRYTLMGISAGLEDDIHPLYRELLEAAGDRELAKEHLEELRTHRDKILYDLEMNLHRERVRTNQGNLLSEEELRSLKSSLAQIPADPDTFRAKFGVSIDRDDLDFLQDYEQDERGVREAVEEATRNVNRLRELCMEKGVMRRNAPLQEDFVINTGSGWPAHPPEGNIILEEPRSSTSLAHPRFPILLSNPTHVLEQLSPMAALEKAMKLPNDSPEMAQRRAECVKELGISNLMQKVESKPDYINQWLIHRLRTSPMEAELMFTISEATLRIMNLRRWQQDVLYFWRKDDAAKLLPEHFQGPLTERDELGVDDGSVFANSVAEASVRAKSEQGERCHKRWSRSIQSV